MKIKLLIYAQDIQSTHDFACEMMRYPVFSQSNFVLHADYQHSGRGQGKNTWNSEFGKGICLSVLFRNINVPLETIFDVHLICSLAIIDACLAFNSSNQFRIKWPNDIILDDKKIAGILIQNNITGKNVTSSVVSIGLNVYRSRTNDLPRATSLEEEGTILRDKKDLIREIISRLKSNFYSYPLHIDIMTARYERLLWKKNQWIIIQHEGHEKKVKLEGINRNGTLLISIKGAKHAIHHGSFRWSYQD